MNSVPRRTVIDRLAAVPLTDADVVPRSTRQIVMSGVTAIVAGLILWSVYAGGKARGMDHVLAYGLDIDATPIAVALSESVYGVDLGYIGLSSVFGKLVATLSQNSNNGRDQQAMLRNVNDRQLIDQAITDAASLGSQKVGSLSQGTLMTMMYQDLGSVDYIKLSFRLFGRRIAAIYNTFFVVVGVSAVLFLLTFPNSVTAQLVLLSTLFAFQLELQTPIFTPGMPTFATLRHASTLCLIPTWYFAGLIVQRRKLSWASLALAIGQLAVLILALQARSTVMWALMLLGVLAMASGFVAWRSDSGTARTWTQWLRRVVIWPVLLLLVTVVVHSQYMKLKLHPIYSTDDVPPYHPLWHSAYIGLFYSPELYGFPVPPGMLGGDALAFEGALRYLESIHFISNDAHTSTYEALRDGGYFSRWNGGNPKWTLHDEIIRRLFIRTVLQHPAGMLRLYLVKKPVAIAKVIGKLVLRSRPGLIMLTLAGGLFAALFWIVFGDRTELRQAVLFGPVGVCAIVFSLLPCEWAYPVSWTVTDGFLLALTVLVVGIGMALAACYNMARPA